MPTSFRSLCLCRCLCESTQERICAFAPPCSRTGSCSLEILGSHARIHRVKGSKHSASILLHACCVWNGCCTQPASATRVRRFAPRKRLEGVAQNDALKKPTQSAPPQRCYAGDVARYVLGSGGWEAGGGTVFPIFWWSQRRMWWRRDLSYANPTKKFRVGSFSTLDLNGIVGWYGMKLLPNKKDWTELL